MKILHSVTASTNSAKYTIKSVSDEGTYYLVKDWRKNKELWVSKEKMDRHPEWWFTSSGKAKQSLKSLLSVMDEYLSDTFTVVDMFGNETPLDVKELGFDHIPEYWDDDIDACDKVISSTRYKANMVSASDDGTDESEWYDWWNDVDGYLLNYDEDFKKLIYDFRDKYGWPQDMRDDICDKLGDVIFEYVKTNVDKLGIDTSENTDADYSEFANERMIEWLIEPYLYGDFWNDYKSVKGSTSVTASSFDSAYDENDNLYQFHVAGYLGDDYRGLMEDWYTNDFDEALEHASDMGSQGLFVKIENQADGRSRRLTPDDWEDAASYGEYPDHIREDLAF